MVIYDMETSAVYDHLELNLNCIFQTFGMLFLKPCYIDVISGILYMQKKKPQVMNLSLKSWYL